MRRTRFHSSRVAAGALAIGVIVAVLTAAPAVAVAMKDYRERLADRADPLPASATEQAAILRAILDWPPFAHATTVLTPDAAAASGETDFPFVLADTTDTFCLDVADASDGAAACALLRQVLEPARYGRIPTKLIRNLVAANQRTWTGSDPSSAKVRLAPSADIEALRREADYWAAFDRRYPDTRGLIRLTRAVLTRDGSHALIYLTYGHRWFGFGDFFHLARSGDAWIVECKENFWIS